MVPPAQSESGFYSRSLSLRRHAHGMLAKRLMHMAHFSGNTSGMSPVQPGRDLAPSSSCPADQEDAGGAGSNTILGRGPWRLGKGWRLAERECPRVWYHIQHRIITLF